MFYLPSLRRLLLPVLILLPVIVFYRSSIRVPTNLPHLQLYRPLPPEGVRVPLTGLPLLNTSSNHLIPAKQFYYSHAKETAYRSSNGSVLASTWSRPVLNPHLAVLFRCPTKPNRYTNHIRLPYIIRNISLSPATATGEETRQFWNPTVISLPFWSENQYLIVSRIVTDGNHQQNVLCEADICLPSASVDDEEKTCTEADTGHLGAAGGMRCVSDVITLSVPPTPAEQCDGKFGTYVDIPGFHDPRVFWSGKGEPLMMVNTQSRYACFGLWVTDLRTLHKPLQIMLASSPVHPSLGPLMSYPSLTELTRNPATDRFPIEKNWMFFFPGNEAYLHYEISPHGGRSFAKLLGAGLTTSNLTDPLEKPCLLDVSEDEPDQTRRGGSWHQATNSLQLVLCRRSDRDCEPNADNTVFFAVVHRKHPNALKLPLRYERYFIVWSAVPPFSMLGVSQHPVLMANETASGWSAAQNWADDEEALREKRGFWAYFTYTVSIGYAWGRPGDEAHTKNVGYLDDLVLLGIGIDDQGQGFATVPAGELLQCLRACPGRESS
ncbi:MAG: hypothetical protein M1832_002426 [Thelocarpon impressellum]|nr:MAG: hypothetical protein M1832_002426 [Thelocarpon impressellum]